MITIMYTMLNLIAHSMGVTVPPAVFFATFLLDAASMFIVGSLIEKKDGGKDATKV